MRTTHFYLEIIFVSYKKLYLILLVSLNSQLNLKFNFFHSNFLMRF